MPRRNTKARLKCKSCGAEYESQGDVKIIKTWHMVSPMPDKDGNITINIFATWECPRCRARNRSKISSIKSGAELRSRSYTERLREAIYRAKEVTLEELAEMFNMSKDTILKALRYLIEKRVIKAKIEGEKIIAL